MWTPSHYQRVALLAGGLAALDGAVVISFLGPDSIPTVGPPPLGVGLELQVLWSAAIVSALLIVLSAWNSNRFTLATPAIGGLLAIGLGGYFAYTASSFTSPPNRLSTPFSFPVVLIGLWGLLLIELTAVSFVAHRGRVKISTRAPYTRPLEPRPVPPTSNRPSIAPTRVALGPETGTASAAFRESCSTCGTERRRAASFCVGCGKRFEKQGDPPCPP